MAFSAFSLLQIASCSSCIPVSSVCPLGQQTAVSEAVAPSVFFSVFMRLPSGRRVGLYVNHAPLSMELWAIGKLH